MRKMAQSSPDLEVSSIAGGPEILKLRKSLDEVFMKDTVESYILHIVDATRHPETYGLEELGPMIRHGASPRASINLAKASKACAMMDGRDYVLPADVRAIANEVMRHRIALTYKAEAKDVTPDEVVEQIFKKVPVPS